MPVNTNLPYALVKQNRHKKRRGVKNYNKSTPEQKNVTEDKSKQNIIAETSKSLRPDRFVSDYECDYEIFAYCSENYKDAYDFVINSWLKPNITKITIYTDFKLKPHDKRIEIIPMFENQKSEDWIVGTGRRLDIINHFSEMNYDSGKRILFLDIDCYIVKDVSHIFSKQFDIGITRLYNNESHTNNTATAGLWWARMNPQYQKFIDDWTRLARIYKNSKRGVRKHFISYVQYSFTDVARKNLNGKKYKILPIDENFYNSEHSNNTKWLAKVRKCKPYILHFKGRKFRDANLSRRILKAAGV